MRRLTDKEVDYLIENEDKCTIGAFAKLFGISPKEVYAVYDRITKTDRYKEKVAERTSNITGKIKRSIDEQNKIVRKKPNIGSKISKRLPLIYISNDTYDRVSSNIMQDCD